MVVSSSNIKFQVFNLRRDNLSIGTDFLYTSEKVCHKIPFHTSSLPVNYLTSENLNDLYGGHIIQTKYRIFVLTLCTQKCRTTKVVQGCL